MTATETQELALTPTQIEGPYYTIGSPHRASLIEPGITGTRLRGHVYADKAGRYSIETTVPACYEPRHEAARVE